MKNELKIVEELTNTPIYFCYGEETYNKRIYKEDKDIELGLKSKGVCWLLKNGSICIGVKDTGTILDLHCTVVHELSHAVTFLIDTYGFEGDEFRSYCLALLYRKAIDFLDDIIIRGEK